LLGNSNFTQKITTTATTKPNNQNIEILQPVLVSLLIHKRHVIGSRAVHKTRLALRLRWPDYCTGGDDFQV
jgi:hypothetical protein